jgi:hypothetical protein
MTRWSKAPSQLPSNPLELWNYDGNQFARLVREALCELELPYILRAAGKVRACAPIWLFQTPPKYVLHQLWRLSLLYPALVATY